VDSGPRVWNHHDPPPTDLEQGELVLISAVNAPHRIPLVNGDTGTTGQPLAHVNGRHLSKDDLGMIVLIKCSVRGNVLIPQCLAI
jgi:hypothetical protein